MANQTLKLRLSQTEQWEYCIDYVLFEDGVIAQVKPCISDIYMREYAEGMLEDRAAKEWLEFYVDC